MFGPAKTAFFERDVDDVAADALLDEHAGRRAADEEGAACHHGVEPVIVGSLRLEERRRARETCVVDDDVDAAEPERCRFERGRDGLLVRDVHRDGEDPIGVRERVGLAVAPLPRSGRR